MDSISKEHLTQLLQAPVRPIIIDVRRDNAYAAASGVVPGAVHRDASAAISWASEVELARPIVVYCTDGGEPSQSVAKFLRERGQPARYLEGGFGAWEASGNAITSKPRAPSQWVTRERPKIDRIACPWLIRRFVDPEAEFAYVPTPQVKDYARRTGAIPYDIDGVEFSHEGERCSFDTMLRIYDIHDPALDRLAVIVRGADTARLELAPQAAGLLAISLGLSANFADDHARLAHGLVVYDALYPWCRNLQPETHNWPTPAVGAA